jgi:hypothetical protein
MSCAEREIEKSALRWKGRTALMKKLLLWLIIAAVSVIGFVLYRSRSANNLNVTPDAREVIEKAKQR